MTARFLLHLREWQGNQGKLHDSKGRTLKSGEMPPIRFKSRSDAASHNSTLRSVLNVEQFGDDPVNRVRTQSFNMGPPTDDREIAELV